jgi:hypothetical protein
MDWAQVMRIKENPMQGEITKKDPNAQEMIVEIEDNITHLLIHPGSFMHMKSQRVGQTCLLL